MVEIDEYGRRRNRHYTGPPGQGNGPFAGLRHTRPGDDDDDFIAEIGHWFEDNGQTMPAFLSLAVLAILAVIAVAGIVCTWRSGDPCSAIILGVVCAFVALRFFWIALCILYGIFWLVFFVGRLIFKNATWFTTAVVIYLIITHPDAIPNALDTLIGFVQSLGIFPASQLQ